MLTVRIYKGRGKPYKMMARYNIRDRTAETSDLTSPWQDEATGSEATGPGQELATRLDQTPGLADPSPVFLPSSHTASHL